MGLFWNHNWWLLTTALCLIFWDFSSRQSEYQIYGFMKHLSILLGKQTFFPLTIYCSLVFLLSHHGKFEAIEKNRNWVLQFILKFEDWLWFLFYSEIRGNAPFKNASESAREEGEHCAPKGAHHFSLSCLSCFPILPCTVPRAPDLGSNLCISETVILRTRSLYLFHYLVKALRLILCHPLHIQHSQWLHTVCAQDTPVKVWGRGWLHFLRLFAIVSTNP